CVQHANQSSHTFDDNQLRVASELFRSIYQALLSTVIGPAAPSSAATKQLLHGVLQCSMTTATLAAERERGASASAIAPITAEYVLGLEALENWRATIEAYDAFIAKFPASGESIEFTVARAKVLWEKLGDLEGAYEGYNRAAALYAESSGAAQCVLNQALIRVEDERYEDAYDLCQELLLRKQPRSIEGAAEYILAVCETGLGYAEEGRERMARVADSYAGDFAGERALYWLGMSAVGVLDYERAEARLAEYIERYPNGADVGGVKHTLDQLAALGRTLK
ncbi:MAG: tetratricopeptide repeat protein, partial [Candidatus Hydrogenedentota bacterium]